MGKLLSVVLVLCLCGCSAWDGFKEATGMIPETSTVELTIKASDILNVREGGQSSPVILRIHELTSPVLFRSMDFFALFESDKAALSDEYIKRYEYQVKPGDDIHEILTLDAKTRALGVSVAFRNIDGATWRKVFLVDEKTKYSLRVNLKGNEMSLKGSPGVEQTYF